MDDNTIKDKLINFFDDFKEYLNVRKQILSLDIAEKIAKTLATISSSLTIIIFLSLFILFASFSAAFAIGSKIGYGLGFLIVAGFYLLIGIIGIIFKKKIEKPIGNAFIKMFFNKNDDDE